jgi:hypothetical protein
MKKLDEIIKIIQESRRQEWAEVVKEFFTSNSKIRKSMLNLLYKNKGSIARCADLGLWESPIRVPQQISPIDYLVKSDFSFEMAKYISTNIDDFRGKSVFEVGVGSGLVLMMLSAFEIRCAGAEEASHLQCATILGAVLNKLEVDLRETDSDIDNFDIFLFPQVFYTKELAVKNLDNARRLRAMGKRIIISSESLWRNSNSFVKLKAGEGKLITELNWHNANKILFELK